MWRIPGRFVTSFMIEAMEGFGGLFGDPEEMRRRMEEFQEQMQGAQKVAWADNAIRLAVEMTVAAISSLELSGSSDEQACRYAMRSGSSSRRRSPWCGRPRGPAGLTLRA